MIGYKQQMFAQLCIALSVALFSVTEACKCYVPYETLYGEPVVERVLSKMPHEYLKESDLPAAFDWRNVNSTNFGSRVMTQQNPSVCGSCWAEAATGALSDRYVIATGGKLRVQLAPQQLLNFNGHTTGGSCNGGDSLKAYEFVHKYGISDDTCAPFMGLNFLRGFVVSGMTDVDEVREHQCYICDWNGTCGFVPREAYDLYGVDEYGSVLGEHQMKAEIFARGPIACSLNSDAVQFNQYKTGVITCDAEKEKQCAHNGYTDHVIVIAGWGEDKESGKKFWVGRNSYGTHWGEGSGGGWFRLERGRNTLNMENHHCHWATPAAADVERAMKQFTDSGVGQQ